MNVNTSKYSVKLAQNEAEIIAAQHLRYQVFVIEFGAKAAGIDTAQLEADRFDTFFDHILLIENATQQVVGVYRILTRAAAVGQCGFYGSDEYDLSVFETHSRPSAELGRSCIAPEHRGGVALHLLWAGVADYVAMHNLEILFGLASFRGVDPRIYDHALSHLHYNYAAPTDLRAQAMPDGALGMDILPQDQVDRLTAMRQMPGLVKSYLRLGGRVGLNAFVDREFNCIDVCMVMDTAQLSAKHQALYSKGVL